MIHCIEQMSGRLYPLLKKVWKTSNMSSKAKAAPAAALLHGLHPQIPADHHRDLADAVGEKNANVAEARTRSISWCAAFAITTAAFDHFMAATTWWRSCSD